MGVCICVCGWSLYMGGVCIVVFVAAFVLFLLSSCIFVDMGVSVLVVFLGVGVCAVTPGLLMWGVCT